MRNFDYNKISEALLTTEIVNLLSSIHEYKGKQVLYFETNPDVIMNMVELTKIQSTQSSNAIEGIYTSDIRIKEIVRDKATPRNRSEKEIAGYREVLATIHENYDYIAPRSNIFLHLHRDLYQFSGSSRGGNYKNSDNSIEEIDVDGKTTVRFHPVPAFATPEAVDRICDAYQSIISKGLVDPLLVIPAFILDFLCIHPFNDGNGRMSRLLTLLLLYRAGFVVGKYMSIEMIIEKTKESYYNSLQDSSLGWHEEKNDYKPFVEYYLGVILSAYKEFSTRVEYMTAKSLTAAQRINEIVKNKLGRITKKEIVEICPDLNDGTVERAITELVKMGNIVKLGNGRYAAYVYNYDNEIKPNNEV